MFLLRGFNFKCFLEFHYDSTQRMIDIGKKLLFTICNMFENVQFFRICIISLQKCYYDQKRLFVKNINMGIKNAEFYANSLMPALKNNHKM
jgi:hypothetical protein